MGKWEENDKTRMNFVLRGAHHIFLKVLLVNSRFLWGGRLSFVLCLSGLVVMRRRWGMMRMAILRMSVILVI